MSSNSSNATISRNGSYSQHINKIEKVDSVNSDDFNGESGVNDAGIRGNGEYHQTPYDSKTDSIFEDVSETDINQLAGPIRQYLDAYGAQNMDSQDQMTASSTKNYSSNAEYSDIRNESRIFQQDAIEEDRSNSTGQYTESNVGNEHIVAESFSSQQQNGALLPMSAYKLQYDPNPDVVQKSMNTAPMVYRQNVNIRFLQPPPLPVPGPLIIKEVRDPQPKPAPPLVIRQRPPRPPTPPPLVLRERPPRPPAVPGPKIIKKHLPALPPLPRQVIIERYPPEPPKPRDVIIERWLPYGPIAKRKVIYQKATAIVQHRTPKNMIVNFEAPRPHIQRVFKKLGVQQMDPKFYLSRYAQQLMDSNTLVIAARKNGVIEDITPPNNEIHQYGNDSSALDFGDGTGNESYGISGQNMNDSMSYDSGMPSDLHVNQYESDAFVNYEKGNSMTAEMEQIPNDMIPKSPFASYQPFNDVIQHLEANGYPVGDNYNANEGMATDFDSNNVLGMLNANMSYEAELGPVSENVSGDFFNGRTEIGGESYSNEEYQEQPYDYESGTHVYQ